jgi:hypothetical protein
VGPSSTPLPRNEEGKEEGELDDARRLLLLLWTLLLWLLLLLLLLLVTVVEVEVVALLTPNPVAETARRMRTS